MSRPIARVVNRKFLNEVGALGLILIGMTGLGYTLSPVFLGPPKVASTSKVASGQNSTIPEVKTLPRSLPIRLEIPSINLQTDVITTGKAADGSLEVPERYDVAAWYELSPTPGELGPAVIVGHVDNYLGPAVFFDLRRLTKDASIYIERQDGTQIEFNVKGLQHFDQDNFPTDAVYGNIDFVGLRLITCGGVYNPLTGRYSQNTVVYAAASL